jgi:hypothetical protein
VGARLRKRAHSGLNKNMDGIVLGIEIINLVATLGERDNIVEITCRINVVNKRLHILFGASVERSDSKSGTTAAEMLVFPGSIQREISPSLII